MRTTKLMAGALTLLVLVGGAAAATVAGNYTDTLTFTATANDVA